MVWENQTSLELTHGISLDNRCLCVLLSFTSFDLSEAISENMQLTKRKPCISSHLSSLLFWTSMLHHKWKVIFLASSPLTYGELNPNYGGRRDISKSFMSYWSGFRRYNRLCAVWYQSVINFFRRIVELFCLALRYPLYLILPKPTGNWF